MTTILQALIAGGALVLLAIIAVDALLRAADDHLDPIVDDLCVTPRDPR